MTATISCSNDDITDAIYITGTEQNPLVTLSAEDGVASRTALSVTASQQVTRTTTIRLRLAPELIEQYNKTSGKNYVPVPAGDFELTANEVSITAGTNVSNSVNFQVNSTKNFKTGTSYMMAVTIESSDGDLPILEASRTIYYVVKPVVIQSVASLTGNYFEPDFSEKNAARLTNLSQVSMEARVYVNNFANYSPFISSVMGIEEHFLLRFGDVTISPNQIQRAGMVALTAPQGLATRTWYHIALVHDVSTTRLYVDGVLAASIADNNNINILKTLGSGAYGTGFLIGASAGGRYLDGMISEARLWSKALTQNEIIDGMCGVDPTSKGLEAYWKFNEGSGNIASDISGNGHHAKANRNVTWVPNIRCKN